MNFKAVGSVIVMMTVGVIMGALMQRELEQVAVETPQPAPIVESSHTEAPHLVENPQKNDTIQTEERVVQPKTNPFGSSKLMSLAQEVSYGVLYFEDDDYYCVNETAKLPSASVIKLFIMEYAFQNTDQATLDSSLIKSMIQKSDNTATNQLIDRYGMKNINSHIADSGYKNTVLQRRMLDFEARSSGLENYTSVKDVISFLRRLYDNRQTYPYSEMLNIMKGQTVRTKLPSMLPKSVVIANKTGELDTVENDVGIVFSDSGDFAVAVLSNKISNSSVVRKAIGEFAVSALEYSQNRP